MAKIATTPVKVFHSYPTWQLSGVNTWSVNLMGAMDERLFESEVLFTGIPPMKEAELDRKGLRYQFLDVTEPRRRKDEWNALKSFLENQAPCIYIPNYDFHRSCAVGTLSTEVRVVAVIHSDEACYYDELRRIGTNCDAIVCVSSDLTAKVKQRFPKLAKRVHFIPHGIPLPINTAASRPTDGPLRLCYCNRLQQYQKRVFDLPRIAAELEKLGVNYELDIAGDGPDANELRQRFEHANLKAPVRFHGRITNDAVLQLCRNTDLFLLTSDFEGLPISLLEAMSVGCVPIVYQIESGIVDVIPSGNYGMVIPHGDTSAYAMALKFFFNDRAALQEISSSAADRIRESFSLQRMSEDYIALFKTLVESDSIIRRNGRISIPYDLSLMGKTVRRLNRFAKTPR